MTACCKMTDGPIWLISLHIRSCSTQNLARWKIIRKCSVYNRLNTLKILKWRRQINTQVKTQESHNYYFWTIFWKFPGNFLKIFHRGILSVSDILWTASWIGKCFVIDSGEVSSWHLLGESTQTVSLHIMHMSSLIINEALQNGIYFCNTFFKYSFQY